MARRMCGAQPERICNIDWIHASMLTKITGGRVYDPAQNLDGAIRDVFVRDGIIVRDPGPDAVADHVYDVRDKIVMAGGIDIHSHIAGGNVNTARMLLPEQAMAGRHEAGMPPVDRAVFTAREIGELYAGMGYTTVVEPAMLPCNARDAHMQMADIPVIDKAGLAILGNDDLLLRLLRAGSSQSMINDYVAWTIGATKSLGLKCINAGGSAAFKENVRTFGLNDEVPSYGLTSRTILRALHRAAQELGIAHPLHVHCNNLGVPDSIETALATMDAAEGAPMHLAHVQFYAYGSEGPHGFSSAAAQLIEGLKRHPNITIDIGQVLFGQTVTISGDVIAQFSHRSTASPRKWAIWDAECEGSGGVVPYRYQPSSFINSLQWAIGLELFLLAEDPWRVFFTTDHPNGAPFTRYPELIRLLMEHDYRQACLDTIHPEARAMTLLPSITREFSLNEVAIMTRTAPARLLGLDDRGTLRPGSKADIAVYASDRNAADMFSSCSMLFKDGRLVVRDGRLIERMFGTTSFVAPPFDRAILPHIGTHFDRYSTVSMQSYALSESAIARMGKSAAA